MKRILVLALLVLLALPASSPAVNRDNEFRVLYFELDGAITPAQADFVRDALAQAKDKSCGLAIMRLDTPGGLADSMRAIIKTMLNSDVPLAVWVGPSGAHAASAGVFLVGASAVAAMSPQATIGSAHPVDFNGEDMPDTMQDKVVNDLVSLMRGIAQSRGRNVDWYVSAIQDNANLTASEAVMNRVADFIAVSPEDLLEQIAAKGLIYNNKSVDIDIDAVHIIKYETGLRYDLVSWLLDPQVAYLLLMAGIAGVFFEIITPGAIFPGVFGGITLLLGMYAMSILPTNAAGILLMIFGLVMFVLEAKIVSYGLLGLTGLVSLFFGSMILFNFSYSFNDPYIYTVIVTTLGVGALLGFAGYLVAKTHLRKPRLGASTMIGKTGRVMSWSGDNGYVQIAGELWKARSRFGHEFQPEDRIRVIEIEGLTLGIDSDEGGD